MLCHMAGLSLFVCGWIIFILYVYYIALSIDECLGCFHVLTVVNNAVVNSSQQEYRYLFWLEFSFPSDKYLEVE